MLERAMFSAVLDIGIDKRSFEDDLSERLWEVDIGINEIQTRTQTFEMGDAKF